MKKYAPLVFIVLASGISWLLWIPALVLVARQGYPLPTIDYLVQQRSFQFVNPEHVRAVVLFSLAVYGPLLAGLIAAAMEGGRLRVTEWLASILRWRFAPRWLGLALLAAFSLVLVPLLVGGLAGMVTLRPAGALPPALLIVGLFFYQLLTSGLGEEPGWRGYLLPRWQASLGHEKAIWYTGVVWAVWHFPFTIYYTLQSAPGLEPGGQLAMLVPALLGQTMSLIGMTYIYAWLLAGTRSILLAAGFHALGNTLNALAGALVVANPVVGLAIAAMPWLVVLVLEKTGQLAWIKGQPAPEPAPLR